MHSTCVCICGLACHHHKRLGFTLLELLSVGSGPNFAMAAFLPAKLLSVSMRASTSALLAGEDAETIRPTLSYLADNGIGGILDYAAESDVSAEVRRHS